MAIAKKELGSPAAATGGAVSSVPSDVATAIKQSVIQPSSCGITGATPPADRVAAYVADLASEKALSATVALSKDRSIARSVSINNTFGAGWFKDYAQTVPMEDAVKKAFEVAGQIEAWLAR